MRHDANAGEGNSIRTCTHGHCSCCSPVFPSPASVVKNNRKLSERESMPRRLLPPRTHLISPQLNPLMPCTIEGSFSLSRLRCSTVVVANWSVKFTCSLVSTYGPFSVAVQFFACLPRTNHLQVPPHIPTVASSRGAPISLCPQLRLHRPKMALRPLFLGSV